MKTTGSKNAVFGTCCSVVYVKIIFGIFLKLLDLLQVIFDLDLLFSVIL